MDLDELAKQIDIVDFISQYVELTENSGEWWGLSPLKEEKTPSFSVRRETRQWYDFSSGQGGGIYKLLRLLGKSRREAIEEMKKFAGYDGDVMAPAEKMEATKCCRHFARHNKSEKPYNPTVLSDNYMDRYENRDEKLQIWRDEGISDNTLKKFHVKYDGFSNRIVYPIRDLSGKIVNIGGRTLDPMYKEKKLRKYTYMQGWGGSMQLIYGLYDNFEDIKRNKEIILFEGCKSVLLADTWGIKNTGALLTSHLNPGQAKILMKLGVNVVFMLDKEINIREDNNITMLKNYTNVYYYFDSYNLLGEKDSPVDKGREVFRKLYESRLRYR